MADIHPTLKELGAEVLVVSFTPPAKAAAYLAKYPAPFPVVCDPEREAYRRFGLGRATWLRLFRPHAILGYLRFMLRGWLPQKPMKKDDPLQLGGDFVLDAHGRIVFAHPSQDPVDRPSGKELLAVVRELIAARVP